MPSLEKAATLRVLRTPFWERLSVIPPPFQPPPPAHAADEKQAAVMLRIAKREEARDGDDDGPTGSGGAAGARDARGMIGAPSLRRDDPSPRRPLSTPTRGRPSSRSARRSSPT